MLQSSLFKSVFEAAALQASGGLDLSAASVSQFSPRDSKTEIGTKELLQNITLFNFRAGMLWKQYMGKE